MARMAGLGDGRILGVGHQELYGLFRCTLERSPISALDLRTGAVRDVGLLPCPADTTVVEGGDPDPAAVTGVEADAACRSVGAIAIIDGRDGTTVRTWREDGMAHMLVVQPWAAQGYDAQLGSVVIAPGGDLRTNSPTHAAVLLDVSTGTVTPLGHRGPVVGRVDGKEVRRLGRTETGLVDTPSHDWHRRLFAGR